MATKWQNKTVITDGFFFVLLSEKRLRSHYPSTTEILRGQPFDWQLTGSRLPTISNVWLCRDPLSLPSRSWATLHASHTMFDALMQVTAHLQAHIFAFRSVTEPLLWIFQPCLDSIWLNCQLWVVFVLGCHFRVILTNISRSGWMWVWIVVGLCVCTGGVKIHRYELVTAFNVKYVITSILGPLHWFKFTINGSMAWF